MAIADATGLPYALHVASASPHEVKLVRETLNRRFLSQLPERIIGDKAYDSDPLDRELAVLGVELIAPHKRNRVKPKTQDGRPLSRYRKRWKVERLFAWLQNYRRISTRWEYHLENFLGMVQLGCVLILIKSLLG
jgi:transposase